MKRFFMLSVAVLATLFFASTFGSCSDGDNADGNSKSSDAVVCTYYMESDDSTRYVFYADKTAEYYFSGELANSRSELTYEGNPLQAGTVTVKISVTGAALTTFTVKESDGSIVPTDERVKGFPIKYKVELGEDGAGSESNSDNTNSNNQSTTENSDVVCVWIANTDKTNFYIFYTDKTAEYYADNKIQFARDILTYEGSPTTTGTVKIKNSGLPPIILAAGGGILTFTVTKSGSTVTATQTGGSLKYTMSTGNTSNESEEKIDNGGTPATPTETEDQGQSDDGTAQREFNITTYISDADYVEVEVSDYYPHSGEEVLITFYVEEDYELGLVVESDIYGYIDYQQESDGNYIYIKFIMPESNVTVYASEKSS